MDTQAGCLYTLVHADRSRHEEILDELVAPVTREVRDDPQLDSLFFARYNEPTWQVRYRVLGPEDWLREVVRPKVAARLEPLARRGSIQGHQFATYQRELPRYGGERGMRLAEKIFLHDTLACLDLIAAEREGELAVSRREFSMAFTERLLDLMRLHGERRLAFYQMGYRWAIDMKTWEETELRLLEERYEHLQPALRDLFFGPREADSRRFWGGAAAARIAEGCLESMRPWIEQVLEGVQAGWLAQDPVHLAWSFAHMQCNRLGIDPSPEAILRYLMHRLHQDGARARA